jgi:hypothetical protein
MNGHRAPDFVDFGPTVFDTGYVKQSGTVLPEWTALDIENESNGREVHVGIFVHFDRVALGGPVWRRRP